MLSVKSQRCKHFQWKQTCLTCLTHLTCLTCLTCPTCLTGLTCLWILFIFSIISTLRTFPMQINISYLSNQSYPSNLPYLSYLSNLSHLSLDTRCFQYNLNAANISNANKQRCQTGDQHFNALCITPLQGWCFKLIIYLKKELVLKQCPKFYASGGNVSKLRG